MTAIAVEDIDAVAVWIMAFSSFGYELDVKRSENFIDVCSYSVHIVKCPFLEHADVNFNFNFFIPRICIVLDFELDGISCLHNFTRLGFRYLVS